MFNFAIPQTQHIPALTRPAPAQEQDQSPTQPRPPVTTASTRTSNEVKPNEPTPESSVEFDHDKSAKLALPQAASHPHPRDALDALIDFASDQFQQQPTWEAFAAKLRGTRGDFHQHVNRLEPPAASLLEELRMVGAPVKISSEAWSTARKTEALTCGPHKSAKEHIQFLREEFTEMVL